MGAPVTTIGFDADDTLWQNEQFFRLTEKRSASLLADYADADHLLERLLESEKRNLRSTVQELEPSLPHLGPGGGEFGLRGLDRPRKPRMNPIAPMAIKVKPTGWARGS